MNFVSKKRKRSNQFLTVHGIYFHGKKQRRKKRTLKINKEEQRKSHPHPLLDPIGCKKNWLLVAADYNIL